MSSLDESLMDTDHDPGVTSDYCSGNSDASLKDVAQASCSTCSSSSLEDREEDISTKNQILCPMCPYVKVIDTNKSTKILTDKEIRRKIGKHLHNHTMDLKSSRKIIISCSMCSYKTVSATTAKAHESCHYDYQRMLRERGVEINGWRSWTTDDSIEFLEPQHEDVKTTPEVYQFRTDKRCNNNKRQKANKRSNTKKRKVVAESVSS